MSGAVLVRVGVTAALWVLLLVVVMMVVVGSQKVLLVLPEPRDPSVLLTAGLLGHHGRAVDVVVLQVRGADLVDGVDGEGVLQAAIGHSTVQQRLGHDGGGHSGDVLWDPGLHV